MARLFRRGDEPSAPEPKKDQWGNWQVQDTEVQPTRAPAARAPEPEPIPELAAEPAAARVETLTEPPPEPDWDRWESETRGEQEGEHTGAHFRVPPPPPPFEPIADRHQISEPQAHETPLLPPRPPVPEKDLPTQASRTQAPQPPTLEPAFAVPAPTTPKPQPTTQSGHLLGDLLVERRLITSKQLEEALRRQNGTELRIGEILAGMGAVEERHLIRVLAEQYGIGVADLGRQAPDPKVTGRLTEKVARELNALPLRDVDGVTEIIVGDLRPGLEATLRTAVGGPVQLLAVPPTAARQAIDRVYQALADVDRMVKAFSSVEAPRADTAGVKARDEAITADSPVAKVVTMLVTQALRDRASDIHLEPSDEILRVRFRIDGALNDILNLPITMSAPLVSRIKILSGMNIVERRKAQDGQFATQVDERDIDVRVSTMATVWGERNA